MTKSERPPRRQSTLARQHPAATRTDTTTPAAGNTPSGEARTPRPATNRAKMTINTSEDLIDAAKDTWYATSPRNQTFSAWVAAALWTQIEADRVAAGVDEFPRRPTKRLPAGRPAE